MRALSGLCWSLQEAVGRQACLHLHMHMRVWRCPSSLPHVDVEVCGRSSEPCWGCSQVLGQVSPRPAPAPGWLRCSCAKP